MIRRLLLAAAAAGMAASAVAEVSISRGQDGGSELFFEVSATGPWGRVRPGIPVEDILNEQGDARGDGWPAIAVGPDGSPSVAHATAGDEGEILLSRHDGSSWREPLNVSLRAGADYGPSLAIDVAGTRFVAWTNARGSRSAVLLTAVSGGGVPLPQVSELSQRSARARDVSVAVTPEGDVWIAYEERPNGSDAVTNVAIDRFRPPRREDRTLDCSGENTADLSRVITIRTGITSATMAADATVNVEDSRIWVTWIDGPDRVGWVEILENGEPSEPQYLYYEPEDGPAEALALIRSGVLSP